MNSSWSEYSGLMYNRNLKCGSTYMWTFFLLSPGSAFTDSTNPTCQLIGSTYAEPADMEGQLQGNWTCTGFGHSFGKVLKPILCRCQRMTKFAGELKVTDEFSTSRLGVQCPSPQSFKGQQHFVKDVKNTPLPQQREFLKCCIHYKIEFLQKSITLKKGTSTSGSIPFPS